MSRVTCIVVVYAIYRSLDADEGTDTFCFCLKLVPYPLAQFHVHHQRVVLTLPQSPIATSAFGLAKSILQTMIVIT